MNDNLQKLLNRKEVSEEDRAFWLSRLGDLSPVACESILKLFELLPDQIGRFRIIQERKEKALANEDHQEWDKIVEEEIHHLQSLFSLKN
ncbi:MAG: hypothetical protein G01um101433_431 [Parcubacteria group bacterium Gr01-1014_33]|nr:MAG: hypothetical protein G01um101433_431 [Parcubacteria group bacterium Gr01-1014_33]